MLSASELRSSFIDFFKDKGHQFVPSSPVVPVDDESLLFTNAGMNQFKDIFLGFSRPPYRRAANSQKCLRVSGKHNDLEEVGRDTYHHTFFEMLGNWSFDDYFKAEAIEWAWELLTQVWGIERERLWATVFAGDKADNIPMDRDAQRLWTRLTAMPADRVLAFGRKDNFWEMGDTGPCGPCSEIHIDLGPDRCDKKDRPAHRCGVNAGCARFIELWNLVFIQYNHTEDGGLVPLGAKYIDTGAGLERLAAVLQNKASNYDTDLFVPIIEAVSEMTSRKYTSALGNSVDNAFRVIADHIRAVAFAIADGAMPCNEGRGYVIRRILRRAARFGRQLGMHEPFLYRLVPVVRDVMGDAFSEIRERADYVTTVIESEEESFGRTLDRGIEIFESAARRAGEDRAKTISGEDAFQLYDTYGFPLDLTELMASEQGLKVDTTGFEELMGQQRERARAAQKTAARVSVSCETELPVTEDLHKYRADACEGTIVGFIDAGSFIRDGFVEAGRQAGIVLDRTCFYAEAGGQVGDRGIIRSDNAGFIVENTIRIGQCVVHQGQIEAGTFLVGDKVEAVVGKDRDSTKKNHTATHLLQWALQQVVGKSVAQQGSLVGPDYLRFDFTCPKALTGEQIRQVQRLVRGKITEDLPVSCARMPRQQADKLGAMALFGEKYGSEVRVVALGAEDEGHVEDAFSKEFCGGTHVQRLGSIGDFKIIKEESVSAGVRRITALTGGGLAEYLERRSDIVDELSSLLKVPAEQIADGVNRLIKENKKLAKELKSTGGDSGSDTMAQARKLLEKCEKIGHACVIIGRISTTTVEQARAAVDMLKKKAGSAAIVIGFADGDKATLFAGVTEDLVKRGLKAGEIVKEIAAVIDGRGGGRDHLAQAGGKAEKIDEALTKAAELIRHKLPVD